MIIRRLIADSKVVRRSERGQSISLFVLVIMGALITTTGLVIDGGQKVAATGRAESAAAGASRAAGNAAATQQLGGANPAGAAVLAAKAYLAANRGGRQISISNGVVQVTTSAQEPTILLSIIGIRSVTGEGSAVPTSCPRRLPMIMQSFSLWDQTMTTDIEPRTATLPGSKTRRPRAAQELRHPPRRSRLACLAGATRSGSRSGLSHSASAACCRM